MRTKLFAFTLASLFFLEFHAHAVNISGNFTPAPSPVVVSPSTPSPLFLNGQDSTLVPISGGGTNTLSFGTATQGAVPADNPSTLTYSPCNGSATSCPILPGIIDPNQSYEIGTVTFLNNPILIPSSEDYWLKALFTPSFTGTISDQAGNTWTFGTEIYEIFAGITLNTLGSVNITNVNNNGSGLIQVSTTSPHGLETGDWTSIRGLVGQGNAIGEWQINKINDNTFDLQNSTFNSSDPYTSGGTSTGDFDFLRFAAGPQSQSFANLNPLIGSTPIGSQAFTNESGVPENESQTITIRSRFSSLGGTPIQGFLTFTEISNPTSSFSSFSLNSQSLPLQSVNILGLTNVSIGRIVSGGGFIQPIPEPTTALLVGTGLLALALFRKMRER